MSPFEINLEGMKLLNNLYQYDLRLLLWCTGSRHQQAAKKLAKLISKTGDGYLQILIPFTVYFFEPNQGEDFLVYSALAFAFQLPIYWGLKNTLKRKRPPEIVPYFESAITASDRFSFPSGHSSAAFLLANLTAVFYGVIAWPLYLWAAFVALSRVVLGVHFPTDILAGIFLSTATIFIVLPS
jgi:undecaprenyl-diphosphatase